MADMNRRTYLAGAAGLAGTLAGCTGGSDGDSETTESTESDLTDVTDTLTPESTESSETATQTDSGTETPYSTEVDEFAQVSDVVEIDSLLSRDEVDAEPFGDNYGEKEGNQRMVDLIENYEVARLDDDRTVVPETIRTAEFPDQYGNPSFTDNGIAVRFRPGAVQGTFDVGQSSEYVTSLEVDVDGETYHVSNIFEVDDEGEFSYRERGFVQELDDVVN